MSLFLCLGVASDGLFEYQGGHCAAAAMMTSGHGSLFIISAPPPRLGAKPHGSPTKNSDTRMAVLVGDICRGGTLATSFLGAPGSRQGKATHSTATQATHSTVHYLPKAPRKWALSCSVKTRDSEFATVSLE